MKKKKVLALSAGLITMFCICGAVVMFGLLFQVRGLPLPFLRGLTLQRHAQSQACPGQPPRRLVPGTYLADPVQAVGGWVVVTYTAECDSPGQPRQPINGFAAEDGQGSGCGGSGNRQPITPSATSPLTISVEGLGQCHGAGGLSVITGFVTGPGAVTAQAVFASGASASAPVRAGHFVIVASNGTALCNVRALDAGGAVLAENKLNWPGPKVTAGACP